MNDDGWGVNREARDGELPEWPIGGGETLEGLQWVPLFIDRFERLEVY